MGQYNMVRVHHTWDVYRHIFSDVISTYKHSGYEDFIVSEHYKYVTLMYMYVLSSECNRKHHNLW